MENLMRKIMMVCLMMKMIVRVADSKLHYVGGGKYNWLPHVNLSEWSATQLFYTNDWLYFGFDKYTYNVLEVNKTSYENCMESNFITNVTKGGRDVFQLTEAKSYYFICSRGSYCFQGLKVSINVQKHIPPRAAVDDKAGPETSSAPSSGGFQKVVEIIALIFTLVWRMSIFPV